MFETLHYRAERRARRRAELRRGEIAARLAAALPSDLRVIEEADGVRLSGRRLAERFALDSRLRALLDELRR